MNERAEQILVDMLSKVNDGVDSTTSFLAGEIPEVVSQLLIYHAVKNSIFFLVGFALAVYLYKAVSWILSKVNGGSDDYLLLFIPVFFASILSIVFISGIFTVLQIALAPKIYLLEYAASLVK